MTKRFLRGLLATAAALMAAVQSRYGMARGNRRTEPGPWPTYNNAYDGRRYSTAKSITRENVGDQDVADVAAFVETLK